MTAEFSEPGVRFLYPDNWEISREETVGWPRSVSVHSPTGAFWSVSLDQSQSAQLAEDALQAMQNEYEGLESEPMARQLDRFSLRGFELHFYCLDLLVKAHVLAIPGPGAAKVILYQAEIREFDELQAVFDAISVSLIRSAIDA